jgi:hypothetical protein
MEVREVPSVKLTLQDFFDLETSLHKSAVRNSPDAASALLADSFIEFGSSGTVWNKSSIVESMRREGPQDRRIIVEDFVAQELASDVVLVTYRTLTANQSTLRSSVWKNMDGKWKMVFHQGTPSSRVDVQ